MIRRRVYVSGSVQGVWFRDACRERAVAAGLAGWARNLTDGRVEVLLEGDEVAVQEMVGWCHEGPPRANVTGVELVEEQPMGERGFGVR